MSNPLITRLAVVFGQPDHSDDPKKFVSELARLTQGFHPPELDKAADMLIRSHQPTARKPWPTPAEIIMACEDARDLVSPTKPEDKFEKQHRHWTKEARAKAYDLVRTDLGRRAADEGWVLSLWDFCRRERRLPTTAEATVCRRHAAEFNEAYASLRANALDAKLRDLGDSMLMRRDALAEHAWGVDTAAAARVESDITKRITGERDA